MQIDLKRNNKKLGRHDRSLAGSVFCIRILSRAHRVEIEEDAARRRGLIADN